jgi:hypothetical protein
MLSPSLRHCLAFAWRDWGVPQKASVCGAWCELMLFWIRGRNAARSRAVVTRCLSKTVQSGGLRYPGNFVTPVLCSACCDGDTVTGWLAGWLAGLYTPCGHLSTDYKEVEFMDRNSSVNHMKSFSSGLCIHDKGQPVNTVYENNHDRLCGLVVRVLGYRSAGPGSIPGTTKKKISGSGTGCTKPHEYNWGATW